MKIFKNVYVGTTTEFNSITVDGATDPTLLSTVKILLGSKFVNQDNGNVYVLTEANSVKYFVRTDNTAETGYNA